MSDSRLPKLERRKVFRELIYHLKEIVESQKLIEGLVRELDGLDDDAVERFGELLSSLEVETLDHLGYHIDQLKKCFPEILREAYSEEGQSEDDTTETSRRNGHS